MKTILTALILCSAIWLSAQVDPDDILVGNDEQPMVLLVGSFHFAYYNLDAHVVNEEDQVNVLLPHRQKEMAELVSHILQFRPNKIVVESGPNTGYLMHRYREYGKGVHKLRADEMEQIGFRIMERMGLDTIYGVDAGTLVGSLYDHKDSLVLRPILDSIFDEWDFRSDDGISRRYSRYYRATDSLELRQSLLESFIAMNSEKSYQRGYGAYLNGDFELGEYEGSDALALHWYSRNLRIFRNIKRVASSPKDRILVLYGAGHMGILHHLFTCDPSFILVSFKNPGSK
ncbi:MAG: DUF5694 domain-containing protein [Flavobacteriales bacterium]|nr:DUF5694 domain-containing protein [Flavobacteriales bacterium]